MANTISFELRDLVRNSLRTATIDGIEKVIFNLTVVVGVVGNTYPSFSNSQNAIDVICNQSDTGDQMSTACGVAGYTYVQTNFPPITT